MPLEEREAVNAIWSSFSSSSHPRRGLILQGLLTMCCFSQLSLLTEQLAQMIRIDPLAYLPREVCLKFLGYLDATSLCRAAQVCHKWKTLADDDILWRGICEQHIGQKCHKCGWGLPILDKKRNFQRSVSPTTNPPSRSSPFPSLKRGMMDNERDLVAPPLKRQRSSQEHIDPSSSTHAIIPEAEASSSSALLTSIPSRPPSQSCTRPWKDVYSERMTIEWNWRRGRCTVRTLKGHTDGVMCLQFSESLAYPAFPVLISGSYDCTVRVWNMDTGVELHCLRGHTRAVRALQFDDIKLITGSMDHTLKVWDWRRGHCIRTLSGHTDGVVSLNYDSNVLASGSVDTTIKVWNLRTGGAFTLRGHSDWVNAVLLWDANPGARTASASVSLFEVSSGIASPPHPPVGAGGGCSPAHNIDPGKMLFSASDDGTIRLWDLNLRTCLRTMTGHMSQVQSIKLLTASECDDDSSDGDDDTSDRASFTAQSSTTSSVVYSAFGEAPPATGATVAAANSQSSSSCNGPERPLSFLNGKMPVLISGSLDNTIKLWDVETGKAERTLFGHIEGVWAVASDKLRLVSGSHDRTVKVGCLHFSLLTILITILITFLLFDDSRSGLARRGGVRLPLWVMQRR